MLSTPPAQNGCRSCRHGTEPGDMKTTRQRRLLAQRIKKKQNGCTESMRRSALSNPRTIFHNSHTANPNSRNPHLVITFHKVTRDSGTLFKSGSRVCRIGPKVRNNQPPSCLTPPWQLHHGNSTPRGDEKILFSRALRSKFDGVPSPLRWLSKQNGILIGHARTAAWKAEQYFILSYSKADRALESLDLGRRAFHGRLGVSLLVGSSPATISMDHNSHDSQQVYTDINVPASTLWSAADGTLSG